MRAIKVAKNYEPLAQLFLIFWKFGKDLLEQKISAKWAYNRRG